jgi:hypothetical protein
LALFTPVDDQPGIVAHHLPKMLIFIEDEVAAQYENTPRWVRDESPTATIVLKSLELGPDGLAPVSCFVRGEGCPVRGMGYIVWDGSGVYTTLRDLQALSGLTRRRLPVERFSMRLFLLRNGGCAGELRETPEVPNLARLGLMSTSSSDEVLVRHTS